MAYNTYTQSFGPAFAGFQVVITNTSTGTPAIILSATTGGLVNNQGLAVLDASGNLSVVIDTAQTWTITPVSTGQLSNIPTYLQAALTAGKAVKLLNPSTGTAFGALPIEYQSAVASTITGTTSATTLATITIPGALIGGNGRVDFTALWSHTNNANNKTLQITFGGSNVQNVVVTTTATTRVTAAITNRNNVASQVCFGPAINPGFGSSTTAVSTYTVNTANDVVVNFVGTLANSADSIQLESWQVVVWPKD